MDSSLKPAVICLLFAIPLTHNLFIIGNIDISYGFLVFIARPGAFEGILLKMYLGVDMSRGDYVYLLYLNVNFGLNLHFFPTHSP